MEALDATKQVGEWNRKDKLNFLKVQKILSAVGIFLSIILATNLFLINGLSQNSLTQSFGTVSIVFGLFSALVLFWSIRQTSVIEGSGSEQASETDNNFSRFVLIFQINILFFLSLYYILYFFGQEQLLNGFPNQSANPLDFQKYQSTILDKQTWIQVLSLCTILISLYTLFTASALAHSTSTHRIAVYVFGLVLLYVAYRELNQLRAVQDAFNGVSFQLESWSTYGLYYRSVLTLVFLVLTYLANARRNRLAYLITGSFFLIVVGVTIATTGQVFRDYQQVETYLEGNYLGELGKLSGSIVEGFQCSSKYQKISTLKPAGVCPSSTATNPGDCYLGQNQCPENQLSQIWETAYVTSPQSTVFLACLNTNCQGQVTNYYSQFILDQASWALAFVFFAFVIASFSFQLSTKDKGDNLLRTQQYIFFVIFFVALLVIVILLALPFASQVHKNPNLSAAHIHTQATTLTQSSKFLDNSVETLEHLATGKIGYGQGGCSQFKNFFSSGSAAVFQSVDLKGVATAQTQFNNLLDFDTLSSTDSHCEATSTTCGYIYLLRVSQPAANNADFLYWSSEATQSSTVIDATSVQTLFSDKPDKTTNNRYFGIAGSSEVIDKVLQGSSNSLFVCNTQNVKADTIFSVRILKVDLATLSPKTTSARVLKMHKKSEAHAAAGAAAGAAAVAPVQFAAVQFQKVSFQVHHLQTGKPVVHAQAYVYVEAGVAPAASTLGFSNYCERNTVQGQVSFQGATGEDGLVSFYTYVGNAAVTNWNFYVYASHPGAGHTQNCRRYTVSSAAALKTAPAFDIGLGYSLTGQQTRVVLEWDTLAINRNNWNTENLNLYTTFAPSAASKESFNCHVGATQASCNGVNYYEPNKQYSSQSIDFTAIGDYNYLIFVQRFYYNSATSAAPTDSNWFFSASAATPVLKYYAAASDLPLAVTNVLPSSNSYQTKAYLNTPLTRAAALAWCIQGQTTIQVSNTNAALNAAAAQPLGVWSNLASWSDKDNSQPSSSSSWNNNSVC